MILLNKIMTADDVSKAIENCYYDSFTPDGTYVQVVDAPRLFKIYLSLINSIFDRLAAVEQEQTHQQELNNALTEIIFKISRIQKHQNRNGSRQATKTSCSHCAQRKARSKLRKARRLAQRNG